MDSCSLCDHDGTMDTPTLRVKGRTLPPYTYGSGGRHPAGHIEAPPVQRMLDKGGDTPDGGPRGCPLPTSMSLVHWVRHLHDGRDVRRSPASNPQPCPPRAGSTIHRERMATKRIDRSAPSGVPWPPVRYCRLRVGTLRAAPGVIP